MGTAEPAYLSVAEAARTLGLSEATIYRRVWDGSLATIRLSDHGAIRILRTALEVPAGAPRTASVAAVEAPAHGGAAA